MDIIIMAVLFTTVVLVLKSAPRKWILTAWFIAFVLMEILFRIHVTSPIELSL